MIDPEIDPEVAVKRRLVIDRSKQLELAVLGLGNTGLVTVAWRFAGTATLPFYLGYIAISVAIGLTIYFLCVRFDQPLRRRMVAFLLGTSLFGAAAFRDSTAALFQIEGLFFEVLSGIFVAATLHYLIAKIIGPLLFGRVWCGWACWTAMVLDQLPYKRSPGRLPGRWGLVRYMHFGLSLGLVAALWYGLSYRPGVMGVPALAWFLGGNALYYAFGIILALVLRDNRAFCKYACPVSVPLKIGARYALLKVRGDQERCDAHGACVAVCPMDIKVTDYLSRGERVLSSECILCQACIAVCPEQALSLSFGLDHIGAELLREREPAKITPV
jgi:ferredoxin-type protein NapH